METKILDTESAVRNINGYMKKSTLNVIFVGRQLGKLKDKIASLSGSDKKSAELEYELMIENELPFGKKVADKFIRIARNKFICRYAHQMPSSYATLYELCSNSISDEMWKIMLTKITPTMTGGELINYKTYASSHVNNQTEVVTVDEALGREPKEGIDVSAFSEDEVGETPPSAEEPSPQQEEVSEPIAEASEEDCSQDSELSPQSDECIPEIEYFKHLANDDDAHIVTSWDEALTIDDLVQINTSPNATDEEIGFLMGLINEFEDKVNAFFAAKEGDKEAA